MLSREGAKTYHTQKISLRTKREEHQEWRCSEDFLPSPAEKLPSGVC